ncbi:MAG: BrnA antitoxin family protein [Candidatus Amesbacteria bacterium]|nr:BrnA antitoxin family protein [Candidatus Amesbacteria bacterium]
MSQLKKIPKFKSEKAERSFWQKANASQYVDFSKMQRWIFPNLKLSSKPVTIRLPESIISLAKVRAHRQDTPYQSLIKQWIIKGAGLAAGA